MGCDIHLYVERRESAAWISADTWEKSEYDEERVHVPYEKSFYHARNYDLFAMLANVRNGSGFAGVDTGDGFVPICDPRGLPDDLSAQLQAYVDGGAVDHTPSWLTVAELMAYDWTQQTKKRGWVDAVEWARWRDYGKPNDWSGGISGGAIEHVSYAAMEKAWIKLRDLRGYPKERHACAHLRLGSDADKRDLEDFCRFVCGPIQRPYCQVEWRINYYDQASEFLGTVLPRLWRLGKPDDVRIVFWFDS